MTALSCRGGAEEELFADDEKTEVFDQESYPNVRGSGERMKLCDDAAGDAVIALEEF